jgi:50S ribosomal subunit-associated GTPase HflX
VRLDRADVAVIGLFPAGERQYEVRLDELAALVEAKGGRVVGRFVQRRGVSDRWNPRPGGAARMAQPFSRRTLLTEGKVREIASACRSAEVDVAVFVNALTQLQRTVLTEALGCRVLSADDVADTGRTG